MFKTRMSVMCAVLLLPLTVAVSQDAHKAGDPQSGSQIRAAKTHDVHIRNFLFDPPDIEIQVGDSVRWINDDTAPHSATRTDTPAFDTGILQQGQSRAIVFSETSSGNGLEYFCLPHPNMRGRVTVRMAGSNLATDHKSHSVHKGNTQNDTQRAAKTFIVRIKDQSPYYDPPVVEVQVGDSVTWTNDGQLVHTASRDLSPAFETGPLSHNQSKTIQFNQASSGEGLDYFCRPHPYMKGKVVVKMMGSHLASAHSGPNHELSDRKKPN